MRWRAPWLAAIRRAEERGRASPRWLGVFALAFACARCWAQTAATPAAILVEANIDPNALAAARVSSSDAAALLPGVDVAAAGAVSGVPVIHGLGDDRLRILVNDVPVAAACPMHMNPALSYIDPSNVARIEVLPGVTPVSQGGDSIGGTIVVESAPPTFAAGQSLDRGGSVSSFYRSNSAATGAAADLTLASSDLSIEYQGSGVRARDYRDGEGETINASRFETSNQQVTTAYRSGENLFEVRAALQYMPYEEFPNADMDLSRNVGAFLNTRYQGSFGWGDLRINAYYDHISHQMNGNAPDRSAFGVDITSMGLMPTQERGQDVGYRAAAAITASAQDTLRVGNELHVQTLDDRWPGAPVGMPFDYVNLNHATREQLGTFAEWERRWGDAWTTQLGARNDTVWMDAGPVQGYDGIDPTAQAFNATERARTDVNVDATLLARYQPDDLESYNLGLARKNRSPNFYERYAWGTNTIGMVTWFGDGNGYTGNPNLKPETADTVSASGDWHDSASRLWEVRLTGYYTAVHDFIGVTPICGPECSGMPASQLIFANHNARLYGIDMSGAYTLLDDAQAGVLRLTSVGGLVRGQDLSTHTNLYHMIPLHGTLALEHQRGPWSSALELHAVDRKTDVDDIRQEPETPGYAVIDARTAYNWRSVRIDAAVTNLFDRQYENPLGGTWQSALYPPGYAGTTFRPLPAPGRSFDVGVTVRF
jgi:iron complex outermembrane recepter protein